MLFPRSFMPVLCLALFCAVVSPVAANAQPASGAKQQVIMGWVEYIYLQDLDGRLKGKLDTGATTSSMRAEVIKILDEEDSKDKSVIFQVEDADGRTNTLQRKLIRWVKIKGKSGKPQRRPVVEMGFCVAGHKITSEVNLAPRKDFTYPILVGRNMLRDANIIVDPNRTFTSRARCPDMESEKDN